MSYLIDTDVAIHLRDGVAATAQKIGALSGGILMSALTRAELESGVYRHPAYVAQRRARLDTMLGAIPTLAFDGAAAETYGRIVESAGYSRRKLMDRLIASQALVHRLTLVTHNGADFADVPGLSLLVW